MFFVRCEISIILKLQNYCNAGSFFYVFQNAACDIEIKILFSKLYYVKNNFASSWKIVCNELFSGMNGYLNDLQIQLLELIKYFG